MYIENMQCLHDACLNKIAVSKGLNKNASPELRMTAQQHVWDKLGWDSEIIQVDLFGTFATYRNNGNTMTLTRYNKKGRKVSMTTSVKNDNLWLTHGEQIMFVRGKIRERYFCKQGKREGSDIYYYPGGKKWKEATYVNGKRDGNYFIFRNDGTLKSLRVYRNGKSVGKLRIFNKRGELTKGAAMTPELLELPLFKKLAKHAHGADLGWGGKQERKKSKRPKGASKAKYNKLTRNKASHARKTPSS